MGDLLGTGTISGPEPESRGCLLERTWRGTEPLTLPGGETRKFLEDGDEVTFRGHMSRPGSRADRVWRVPRGRDSGMSRVVDVVITYLELTAPDSALTSGHRELPPGVELRLEQSRAVASIAGAMYRAVGAGCYWLDRVAWTDEQWRDEVDRAGVELWTARVGDAVAGYFELHVEGDAVELKYFGLMPAVHWPRAWRSVAVGRRAASVVARAGSRDAEHLHAGSSGRAAELSRARISRVIRTERQQRTLPS